MFKVGDIVCCEADKVRQQRTDHYKIISVNLPQNICEIVLYKDAYNKNKNSEGRNLGKHHMSIFYIVVPKYKRNLPAWW